MSSTVHGAETVYVPNNLNLLTNVGTSGIGQVTGRADEDADVRVNGNVADRERDVFFASFDVDNSQGPVLTDVLVEAVKTGVDATSADTVDEISGKVFTAKASQDVSHDSDGNILEDGRWSYEWDAENRLKRMTKLVASEEAMTLAFTYDQQGRRRSKVVTTGSGAGTITQETRFAWDGWIMIGQWNHTTTITGVQTYLWGLDLSNSEQGAGGIGGLLAVSCDTETLLPFHDGMGNIQTVSDASSGTLDAVVDYGPFGERVGSPTSANPFWYSSKFFDEETGFAYYGYRYYNPETGRWLNRDPIGERGGVNLYGFVGNNPVNQIDALGEEIVTAEEDQSYRDKVISALESIAGGSLWWCQDDENPEEWTLIVKTAGSGKQWSDLVEGIDATYPIRIENGSPPEAVAIGPMWTAIVPSSPRIKVYEGSGTEYQRMTPTFAIMLWHELVGHVILGKGHPREEWNTILKNRHLRSWISADRRISATTAADTLPPNEIREPNGRIDPTIAIENEARAVLGIQKRYPLYWTDVNY